MIMNSRNEVGGDRPSTLPSPAAAPGCGHKSEAGGELRALRDAAARQLERNLARWAEGERDCDGSETDAERADVEPEVAAGGVIEPAARPGTQCHAKGRGHVDRAEHRSHDPGAEIVTHENGVERHHRAVGKAEHQREAIEAREIAGEHVKTYGEGLEREAEDDHALCADAIGCEPANNAAT